MYAINIDENKRILRATYEQYADSESILVEELPTGETAKEKDITNYLYEDGQYVYEPLPDTVTPEPVNIDRLEAQITYTALVTDTLIEEGE